MTVKLKNHETIGCCGIDCGLCPRFYTQGNSACPGCGGLNFWDKHPSCGVLSCCAIKKGFEVCSQCPEYPCQRFDPPKISKDSFVTHKRIFNNLDSIKVNGLEYFLVNQKDRMEILADLLNHFDEGRSKSFYCIGCALLPIDKLQEIVVFGHQLDAGIDQKEKCKRVRELILKQADSLSIDLRLDK